MVVEVPLDPDVVELSPPSADLATTFFGVRGAEALATNPPGSAKLGSSVSVASSSSDLFYVATYLYIDWVFCGIYLTLFSEEEDPPTADGIPNTVQKKMEAKSIRRNNLAILCIFNP